MCKLVKQKCPDREIGAFFYWAVIDPVFWICPFYCRSESAREDFVSVGVFFEGVHIHSFGNGDLWFRPYGESLLSNDTKGTKKSRPERTAPRQGSGFLRSGIHPGASPSGWLRWHLHAMSSTASNGAARQSPDKHLRSACRGGGWIKIKSCRRANARPDEW
ncbi:hypothetical protein EMIT0P43_10634 [Pseudomonas jessenii]